MKPVVSLIVLVGLGVLAALSAAILMATMRSQPLKAMAQGAQSEVKVLVASEKLPAMSVVNAAHVVEKTIQRGNAPDSYMSDSTQVIGKILALPLEAGQPFTKKLFPTEGTGFELAGKLPPGMRAVTVSLNDHSGLQGLLYPGSIVDVLVAFDLPTNSQLGEALSTNLLEAVQVLAVENLTVSSEEKEPSQVEGTKPKPKVNSKNLLVTLMVDTKQAKALQLAIEKGKVSLALRNPLDEKQPDEDATLLNKGQLAMLAEVLNAEASAAAQKQAEEPAQVEEAAPPPPPPPPPPAPAPEPKPAQTIDVYRGTDLQTVTLPTGKGDK